MSFDPKNKDHKAQLYRALVAAAELSNARFDEFLQIPFNPPWALAPNYRRNLQRGDYSAIRAQVLYEFLRDHHFTVAHRAAPDIFPYTPAMRWREILDHRATSDRLRLVFVPRSMGIVERESQLKPADTTIRLGQLFCFELDSETDGYAIALQGRGEQWHGIPLGPEGEAPGPIHPGTNRLPQRADGALDPFSENHHEGPHDFVLITAEDPTVPVSIDRLISWVHAHPCSLYRTHVQVMA